MKVSATSRLAALPARDTELGLVHEDLWCVGATAFTLLAGRPVYHDARRSEQLALSSTRPAPALAALAPDVPRHICSVIQRALDCETQCRWPGASAMRAALEAAVTGYAIDAAQRPAGDDADTASATLDDSEPTREAYSDPTLPSRCTAPMGVLLLSVSIILLACVTWWMSG